MKKVSVFLMLLICFPLAVVAASSAGAANRKTAVRCLKLAENYLSSRDLKMLWYRRNWDFLMTIRFPTYGI